MKLSVIENGIESSRHPSDKHKHPPYRHGMLLVKFLLDKLEEEGRLADIRVSDHDEFEDQRCV